MITWGTHRFHGYFLEIFFFYSDFMGSYWQWFGNGSGAALVRTGDKQLPESGPKSCISRPSSLSHLGATQWISKLLEGLAHCTPQILWWYPVAFLNIDVYKQQRQESDIAERKMISYCIIFILCFLSFIYSIFHNDAHYIDVTMGAIPSQITSLAIVYLIVYSGADQRKHQSSASLAFVRGIHQWSVNSPHKWPVTRKKFPFDDVIMATTEKRFPHRWLPYTNGQ